VVLDDPKRTPEATAVLAACLVRGLVVLGHLTPTQVLCLTGADEALFNLANALTTAELDAVASGKLNIHDVIAGRLSGARHIISLSRLAS
jgi:hypothetical protein